MNALLQELAARIDVLESQRTHGFPWKPLFDQIVGDIEAANSEAAASVEKSGNQLFKILIGIYITSADVGNAYGASGSLVVFLFWVYYSSSLVLFGAKFTYEYTKFNQVKIESSDHAAFVKRELIDDSVVPTSELD